MNAIHSSWFNNPPLHNQDIRYDRPGAPGIMGTFMIHIIDNALRLEGKDRVVSCLV